MKSRTIVLCIFGLFWSVIVLAFDVGIANAIFREWQSLGFREVPGRVIASRTEIHRGDKAPTYKAIVTYGYKFDGKRYESSQFKATGISSTGKEEAEETVRRFSPGTNCRVFVNPKAPEEAVLLKGFTVEGWFTTLFLTPFNVAMVGIWYGVALSRRPARPIGGAEVLSEGQRLNIRWATLPAEVSGLITFGVSCFVGLFVVLALINSPINAVSALLVWTLAGLAGYLTWNKLRHRNALTHPDLILDSQAGTLALIQAIRWQSGNWGEYRAWKKAGRPPKVIRLENIRAVGTAERVVTDSDGETKTQVAVLQVFAGESQSIEQDVGSWTEAEEAKRFAAWLRETLGVPDIVRKPAPSESENGSWDNPAWRN